jgi:hypothetical protein
MMIYRALQKCFFLRGEIVLNIEELADLGDAPVLYQTGHLGAGELQKGLNVEVVGRKDHLEEDFLVKIDELSIPGGCHIAKVVRTEGLFNLRRGVIPVKNTTINGYMKMLLAGGFTYLV